MNTIYVSSCLLKKKNKILITSRPKEKFLSGFYELPGGKLKKNESFIDCVKREIKEEINLQIHDSEIRNLDLITHKYKKTIIIMMVFMVNKWRGKIRCNENQKIAWISPYEIRKFKFLPGSQILFDRLYNDEYKIF
jgi:8-oxo-dGTP diphosphatase